MVEDFSAEGDDRASGTSSHSANNPCGGVDMEIDWEQVRPNQEKAINELLSQRDPEHIKEGIEAYNRDLPHLLRDNKERYAVAYDGSVRVGIAKTREKLLADLKRKGLANNKSLFVKIVSSMEDREKSCASNHL